MADAPSFEDSKTGRIIQSRKENDRDAKVIITARSAATGVGKTTLAIILCRWADEHEWSAAEKGFVDVDRYVDKYTTCNKGSALLADELEHGADRRRPMSQGNVDVSHAWAQLRYRNVVTVATLPTVEMLDKRMLTLSDLWINVVRKGVALPYYVWINDFTGEINRKPLMRNRRREILRWNPIDDEDFSVMDEKKDKIVRGEDKKTFSAEDLRKAAEKAEKEARVEARHELIHGFYRGTDMTQKEVSDLPGVNLDQASVSRIVQEWEDDDGGEGKS